MMLHWGLSAWPKLHPWCCLHFRFLLPSRLEAVVTCIGSPGWGCQVWSALETQSPWRRMESKVLDPHWQSQSQQKLDEKAGTVIGKIKAREFREPSRGNLKPGEEAFCGRFPSSERELLWALPALTSTLESGCAGDHGKDKKGGSWYPFVMLGKRKSREQ